MEKLAVVLVIILISIVLVSGCVQDGKPGCAPDWSCTDWSECTRTGPTSGTQIRTCEDLNNCSTIMGRPTESQTCSLPRIASKEPSEMALSLEDLPQDQNYTLKERTERTKSDVSSRAIDLGWEKGYYVRFARIGDMFDTTGVEHVISIYPLENITKILDLPQESEYMVYDELSKPNIGDDSRAFRITWIDEFGYEQKTYQIEFIKMNVYEALFLSGTTLDYEFLKDLASKAESKVS